MAKQTLDQKAAELKSGDFGTVQLINEEIILINKKIYKLEEDRTVLEKKRKNLKVIEELEK